MQVFVPHCIHCAASMPLMKESTKPFQAKAERVLNLLRAQNQGVIAGIYTTEPKTYSQNIPGMAWFHLLCIPEAQITARQFP